MQSSLGMKASGKWKSERESRRSIKLCFEVQLIFSALMGVLFLGSAWIGISGSSFAQSSKKLRDLAPPVENVSSSKQSTSAEGGAATDPVQKLCGDLRAAMRSFGWRKTDPCKTERGPLKWISAGSSVKGRPLIYAKFGDPQATNRTLVLSAIHGDEITPVFVGIALAHWLQEHESELKGKAVFLAPLVNPDGFLDRPRTRTNANGVDVNRNFATSDWNEKALQFWKQKYGSDRRRYPGPRSRSEPETLFQEEMIRLARPQKIMGIHSPLNHLDFDGPSSQISLAQFPTEYIQESLRLRKQLRAISTGFFPGSLGNYAGKELGIPTLTLELPSADPNRALRYWRQFSQGIRTMIDFEMPQLEKIQSSSGPNGNPSQ